MYKRNLLTVLFLVIVSMLFLNTGEVFSDDEKSKDKALLNVVQKTLGNNVKVLRTEPFEDSPVPNWKQTKVWLETVYGETPVFFYLSDDGKYFFAGSIFDSTGEVNISRKDVGETKAKVIELSKMELNDNYKSGEKDAPVKIVMWIGLDPYSKEIFKTIYGIYTMNTDKVALYYKFYPNTPADVEKMKALTCYRDMALTNAFRFIFDATVKLNTPEDIDSFKKSGDSTLCNDKVIIKNLQLAVSLKMPRHPVIFVNGTMLLEGVNKENVDKLAGDKLK